MMPMLLRDSVLRTAPWRVVGLEGVPAGESAGWASAMGPVVELAGAAEMMSTLLTLCSGDVKPEVSEIVLPALVVGLWPVWCASKTRNHDTAKTAVYAALTTLSRT